MRTLRTRERKRQARSAPAGLMTAPYNINAFLCSLSRYILAASLAVRHFGDLARPTIHP